MDMNNDRWNNEIVPEFAAHLKATSAYNGYPQYGYQLTDADRKFWFGEQELKEKEREIMMARAEVREEIRERDKAIMDVVAIDENGVVAIEVINTRKKYARRSGTNFQRPELTVFINESTGQKVYGISIEIGNQKPTIWLGQAEVADAKKMLKKFNAAGADFLTNKNSLKKEYITQLWGVLLRDKVSIIFVPENLGWSKDKNGNLKFVEVSQTWKDMIKKIEKP